MISEEQLTKLKADHPGVELHHLPVEEWDVSIVVRVPTPVVWLKFNAAQATEDGRYSSLCELVTDSLVYPPRAEYDEIVKNRPALKEEFALEVRRIAGAVKGIRRKKL